MVPVFAIQSRPIMSCPCGKPGALDDCCGPFLAGESLPRTAEDLMRSRYVAYTQEAIDYIVETHAQEGRDDVDRDAAATWARQSEWLGLEIVRTEAGGSGDATGVVEFIARYRIQGRDMAHHEVARFCKEDDRWYYADGDMVKARPVVRDTPRWAAMSRAPAARAPSTNAVAAADATLGH